MDAISIQYGIIGLIFIIAVIYLVKRFLPSKGGKSGGCGKGCSCAIEETVIKK